MKINADFDVYETIHIGMTQAHSEKYIDFFVSR